METYTEYFEGESVAELRDQINACIGNRIDPHNPQDAAQSVRDIALTVLPMKPSGHNYIALVTFEMKDISRE